MEYSVKLAHLPAEVSVPGRLSDRFRYDAARGVLVYRGFMTKCAYDEISALSDNLDYHRAVEQLFVLTSADVTPRTKGFSPAVLVGSLVAAVIVAVVAWGTIWHSDSQATARPDATATASTGR